MNLNKLAIPPIISNFKQYYDQTAQLLSLFVSFSLDNMLLCETFALGVYYGSLNGELSDETIIFINNVVGYAKINTVGLAESDIEARSSEIKSQEASLLRKHIAENIDLKVYNEKIKSGELMLLKAIENSISVDYAIQSLKGFYYRFVSKVIEIDDNQTTVTELALQKFKRELFGNRVPDLSYREIGPPLILIDNGTKQLQKEQTLEKPIKPEIIGEKSIEELVIELKTLIGLESVKKDVDQLINFLKIQQIRQLKGMKTEPVSRHLVFYGNPGSGKTTVARLISKIYKSLGIISKGHLVETDRAGMVAGYVGQTALKVNEIVKKAIGGILFIDEAYSLNSGGDQDFGQEAIDTLLKLMEDHRDDLIIIVAGYTDKMEKFLSSNPGLRSRFNKFLNFEDYNPNELTQIFELFCKNNGYQISLGAKSNLLTLFSGIYAERDNSFANGRLVRNIFEMTINKQANRIVSISNINDEILTIIEEVDLPVISELKSINM